MDIKELRIGNYIAACGLKTEVADVLGYGAIVNHRGEEYEESDLEGLPITEHWLESFGFKKVGKTRENNPFWADNAGEDSLLLEQVEGGFIYDGWLHEYVHQIQNLYHGVTGKFI